MRKILFIYGYGGSPDSTLCTLIREALPADEYTVLCPEYPQEDCAKAHAFLLEYVEKEQIDMVIGTSLGGFIALTLKAKVPTIVLNPCLRPSEVLPKLQPRENHPDDVMPSEVLIATYKPFEDTILDGVDDEERWVSGVFAKNDELLGTFYKDKFIYHHIRVRSMPGGHHGNAAAIPSIVKEIKAALDDSYNPNMIRCRKCHKWFDVSNAQVASGIYTVHDDDINYDWDESVERICCPYCGAWHR